MPTNNDIRKLTSFFSALSDNSRLKIIILLTIKPQCVGDIVEILDISQTSVSHQLQILRGQNLVECNRVGKNVYYYLTSSIIENVLDFVVDGVC